MDPSARGAVTSRPETDVGRKRTKPTPDAGTDQVTLRLSVDTLRQLDAEAEKIARETGGVRVGRTDLIRAAIDDWLDRRSKRRK